MRQPRQMSHGFVLAIALISPAWTTASLGRAPSLGLKILGREQLQFVQEWQAAEEHGRGPEAKNLDEYCKGGEEEEFEEQQEVMADWKGYGTHYPGVIHKKHSDGSVDILYNDGWLEERVPTSSLKPIGNVQVQKKEKRDDAVCELAEDVADVKEDLKDANKNVAVYLASQRAAATGKVTAPVEVQGAAPAPAAAEAAAPAPASMSDTDGEQANYLQKLKDELDEVNEAIEQEQVMIDSNDQALQELAAQAPQQATHTKTVDDLIAEYIARIEERKDMLEKLREKRHKQEVQLAGMGRSSVTLEAIQDNIKDTTADMDLIRAKRDKLNEENRLDEELRAAIDSMLAYGSKLEKKVEALTRAKEEAEARKREVEEAEEAAKLAAALAEAAKAEEEKATKEKTAEEAEAGDSEQSEADEQVAKAQLEADEQAAKAKFAKNEAVAREAAERKAAAEKASREAEAKLFKAGEDVEKELKRTEKKADTLDTGIHPHGKKWWRYRYEHSCVESGLMIFVSALMLFYVKVFNWLRMEVYERSHLGATSGTGYTRWLEFTSLQMLACLVVFLTVWILDHSGLFHLLARHLRGSKSMRLPVHGDQYKQVAFDICVVVIFACLFYFLLMFAVVYWNMVKLHTWAEASLSDVALAEEDEGTSSMSASRSIPLSMASTVQAAVPARLRKGMTFFGNIDEFQARKNYFLIHMVGYRGIIKKLKESGKLKVSHSEALESFSFWKYLRMNVRKVTDELLELQSDLWLLIMATFVVLFALHYFLHVGYIRVMAFFLVLQISTLGACAFLVNKVNSTVEAQMKSEEQDKDDVESHVRLRRENTQKYMGKVRYLKSVVVDLLQYSMFFLCYGTARAICQPWMWKLHFWAVLGVTIFTALLAFIFAVVFAPLLPAFAAAMSMPPYFDTENTDEMEKVIKDLQEDPMEAKDFISVGQKST